jgi:hypothetical protein
MTPLDSENSIYRFLLVLQTHYIVTAVAAFALAWVHSGYDFFMAYLIGLSTLIGYWGISKQSIYELLDNRLYITMAFVTFFLILLAPLSLKQYAYLAITGLLLCSYKLPFQSKELLRRWFLFKNIVIAMAWLIMALVVPALNHRAPSFFLSTPYLFCFGIMIMYLSLLYDRIDQIVALKDSVRLSAVTLIICCTSIVMIQKPALYLCLPFLILAHFKINNLKKLGKLCVDAFILLWALLLIL